MPDERHPRVIWHLHSVAGTNTITGSTDHDYKAYRDRMEVRWRPTSFRNYFAGMTVTWTASGTNTGAVTLNINNRGAKALTKAGTALVAGDIVSGVLYAATYNGTEFQMLGTNIVAGGGQGLTVHCGGRALADGTKVAGVGITSVTRLAEGRYRWIIDGQAATSGGYVQMWPVPGVSGDFGDGGDGSSPFKAFDSYQEVATDAHNNAVWDYNASNGKFYLLGPDQSDVYIHTDSTWTTAPVRVDADGVSIRSQPLSGCLSREGGYTWISGDGNAVRVMRNSDNVMFNFGGVINRYVLCATDNLNAMVGSGVAGPRIWVAEGADLKAYDPDITGESLGSAQLTYSAFDAGSGQAQPLLFDNDGYIWRLQGGSLQEANPILASFVTHAYPTETPSGEAMGGSLGGSSRLTYDPLRNIIYAVLGGIGGTMWVWMYRGFRHGAGNSGTWEFVVKVQSTAASIWYEPNQDLLFLAEHGNNTVRRFAGYPKTLLDTITVDDTPGNTSDIERDSSFAYKCFYKSDSTGDYGYLLGVGGATQYFIKISYNGAEISLGDGGSVLTSAFISQYSVVDDETVIVDILRSLSPPVRADAQHTLQIDYTPA